MLLFVINLSDTAQDSQHANSDQVQSALATMLEQAQLLSDELFSFQQASLVVGNLNLI